MSTSIPVSRTLGGLLAGALVTAFGGPAWSQSFTYLDSGFTQDVYGTHTSFLGGIAFAPDGDVLATYCWPTQSPLVRFNKQATYDLNSTTMHPTVTLASNAGCGLTNHPDGYLYTNTTSGVRRLDHTGAQFGMSFGPAGNALGITTDPQGFDLIYVGLDGTLHRIDSSFTATSVFSSVTTGETIDGIAFDPSGNGLFAADRPNLRVTVLDRNGDLVQHVNLVSEPDGIAVHESGLFVVTSNGDGTMSRLEFPAGDFTAVPLVSVFASGGFLNDLAQVGPNGCLYVSQFGTRYDDGTVTLEPSIVQICGDFAITPGTCPGSFGHFGNGVPGFDAREPRIDMDCPAIGTIVNVRVEDASPLSLGTLGIGVQQTSLPYYGGTLLVDPIFKYPHMSDGDGVWSVPLNVPQDASLVGQRYYMQVGYLDPLAPSGVSFSNGINVLVGG